MASVSEEEQHLPMVTAQPIPSQHKTPRTKRTQIMSQTAQVQKPPSTPHSKLHTQVVAAARSTSWKEITTSPPEQGTRSRWQPPLPSSVSGTPPSSILHPQQTRRQMLLPPTPSHTSPLPTSSLMEIKGVTLASKTVSDS